MKYILLSILSPIVALTLATTALAHTGESIANETGDPRFMYMHDIEDSAMGDELHEEMEELMLKMMSGTITTEESNRLIQFMDQYPGPGAMMMHRVIGYNTYPMMGYYPGLGTSNSLVMIILWIFAAIGAVATFKYIFKDKK